MLNINDIEIKLKKNYLLIVFFVSALLHLGEGALTAISYAESVVGTTTSTPKYVVVWIVAFIVFVGVASVSFTSAVAIPSSFKNISASRKTKKGEFQAWLFLVALFVCYMAMQYFFLYVNLLLANAINSNNALQSVNVVGLRLNAVQVDNVVSIQQAHGATIEVLIVYVNITFEILLACAFAFMEEVEDKPKK